MQHGMQHGILHAVGSPWNAACCVTCCSAHFDTHVYTHAYAYVYANAYAHVYAHVYTCVYTASASADGDGSESESRDERPTPKRQRSVPSTPKIDEYEPPPPLATLRPSELRAMAYGIEALDLPVPTEPDKPTAEEALVVINSMWQVSVHAACTRVWRTHARTHALSPAMPPNARHARHTPRTPTYSCTHACCPCNARRPHSTTPRCTTHNTPHCIAPRRDTPHRTPCLAVPCHATLHRSALRCAAPCLTAVRRDLQLLRRVPRAAEARSRMHRVPATVDRIASRQRGRACCSAPQATATAGPEGAGRPVRLA